MKTSQIRDITGSRVYDLAMPIERTMPVHPTHPPFLLTLMRRYGDLVRPDGCSGATEVIIMSGHHSTHMDALGHMSCEGHLHGGADAAEAAKGGAGLRSHDIASPPPVVCRGVLLDIAGLRGRPLDAGEAVTAADIQAAADSAGVAILPGDAVLIRTGWMRHWHDSHTFAGEAGSPGPNVEAVRWLVDSGATLTGSDTMVYELTRPGQSTLPVHGYLLVEQGVRIIEMLNLEELAHDGVYEFLFIAAPLRLVGGTGSPLRPVAIA